MENVTVIIPYYVKRNVHSLLLCVDSVLAQLVAGDELIVVCNGGKLPEQIRYILKLENVRVLSLHKMITSYEARNIGVKHSRTPLVLFTDADVVVGNRWVIEHKRFFRAFPEVYLTGGKTIFGNAETKVSFITCNVGARKNLFLKLKFDHVISGGDLAFSERVSNLGFTIAHNSLAIVYHEKENFATRIGKTLRYGSGTTLKKLWAQTKTECVNIILLLVKYFGYLWYVCFKRNIGIR
jgi:glycosyltransferase involved in cell wall biosynthesis